MQIVVLENIDKCIFDIESKILDILKPLLAGEHVMIDLNNEGPCAESLGLFSILDKMCADFNIDKKLISVRTANAIEVKNRYTIIDSPLVYLTNYNGLKFKSNKIIEKYFGIFIGRSNFNRLFLSAYLFKFHCEKTLQTFHYSENSTTQTGFDQLNRLYFDIKNNTELVKEFLSNYPFKFDEIETYPIINPANMNIIQNYNKIFIDVVCETFYTGNTFYPTEKTVRPILSETPFLVFGPVNYLANLRKLGFETFHEFWPEDYDSYSGITRCNIITDRIDFISRMSSVEINDMYNKMKPMLEHNRNHLKTITKQNFYSTFKNV